MIALGKYKTIIIVCLVVIFVSFYTIIGPWNSIPTFESNCEWLRPKNVTTRHPEWENYLVANSPKLVVYIRCAPNDFEDRRMLRELWIAEIRELGGHVLFLVGLTNDANVNEKLRKEQNRFNDVLIFNFTDAYQMLSVKMFYSLHWHIENFQNADEAIVIWTNIDGYLNVTNLMDYIQVNNIFADNGVIHGGCTCTGICPGFGGQPVVRDKKYANT